MMENDSLLKARKEEYKMMGIEKRKKWENSVRRIMVYDQKIKK